MPMPDRMKQYLIYAARLLVLLLFSVSYIYAATDDFKIQQTIGIDTTPPSVPAGLSATPVATSQINLSWSSSTDDVLLSGYQVFRNGSQVATTTFPQYSDTGLSASTTYTYYVTAFDSSNNISASSTAVATTTLATSSPATSTPSSGGGGGGGSRIELQPSGLTILFLEVIPDTNSVIIHYTTEGFVRSVIRWGETTSYELGSLQEQLFSRTHETRITGLSPGTFYQFVIEGENNVGQYSTMTTGTFMTLQTFDSLPPSNVENLRAYSVGGDIVLEWENPPDPDFEKVRIMRSDSFFPSDTADGWFVYEGTNQRANDEDIAVPGTRQFYSVFSYDKNGNISSGAVVAIEIGKSTVTDVTDVTVIDEKQNEIKLSFDDISFLQDGRELSHLEGRQVTIDGTKQLTMRISYDVLPEHLKTILVTLADEEDGVEKTFSFILRISKEKTAYEAVLAPLGNAGIFPVRVSVFDFKTAQIGYAEGTLVSKIVFRTTVKDETFIEYFLRIISKFWEGYLLLFLLLLIIIFLLVRRLMRREDSEERQF